MAVDRSRLAAALAYRQAEEERRRRMMESVPVPGAELPTPVPSQNLRRDLENLSIGIGEGLTNQLEGVKGIVTDPIGAARGAYEGVKAVVRDPSIIADALRYTAQKVGSGPLGAGEVIGEMIGPRKGGAVMQELDVYHGTPHRFPATEANPLGEFDASKIGTGEGAQAYGHGIYLAESPEVAKDYATRLWKNQNMAGKLEIYDAGTKWEKAKSDFLRTALENKSKAERAEAEMTMNKAHENYLQTMRQHGPQFYKADLPDEMIDRMLDWDKPLSEQHPEVQRIIGEEIKRISGSAHTGERAYRELMFEARMGGKKSASGVMKSNVEALEASKRLQELGIPGIKYLDAGSRGQGGSGTRNFVVFPGEEKKVRILERK